MPIMVPPSSSMQYVSLAIGVALQAGILNYLVRLERIGCACAMDWRRTYMIVFLIMSILISIFTVASGTKAPMALAMALPVFGLLYIVFVLQYINRLKKEKCECSASVFRNIMEVLAYLYVLLMLLGFVFFAMAVFAGKLKTT
jgi:hypothetical protein